MKKKIKPPKLTADLKIKKKVPMYELTSFDANGFTLSDVKKEEKDPKNVFTDCQALEKAFIKCVRCPWSGILPENKKCPDCKLFLGDLERIQKTEGV